MAYATVSDMVARWGRDEMIRLSASDEALTEEPVAAAIELALTDATGLINSYLRRRYTVPLSPVPQEVLRACCILARCDLAQGGGKTPSEEMRKQCEGTLRWLRELADGTGGLDVAVADTGSGARVQDRPPLYRRGPLLRRDCLP